MGDKINVRVAIVTGGSGSAIAMELAQNDYYMIIKYKSNEKMKKPLCKLFL